MTPASAGAGSPEDGGARDDGEPPEWPDESVEAAMIVEQREREGDEPVKRRPEPEAGPEPEDEAPAPLPKLEALVEQIPAEVRETLDELFRARFTTVQRVPRSALK